MSERCVVINIMGLRCQLAAGHEGTPHDYYEPWPYVADPHEAIAMRTAERDAARAELAELRGAIAKEGGAAGFFLAAWKSANMRIAALSVELARERERTAGMLGAEAKP